MFLLDNQAVREDWKSAKALVTDALSKHGAAVRTARRWDERKLAYPIARRQRGTYLLSWFDADPAALTDLRRDLDLSERVLRYLILSSDGLPEGEMDLSEAENAADFSVPAPPADDEQVNEEPKQESEDSNDDESSDDDDSDDSSAEDDEDEGKPTKATAKTKVKEASDDDADDDDKAEKESK
jgi:small subunit ribosomal protein S6